MSGVEHGQWLSAGQVDGCDRARHFYCADVSLCDQRVAKRKTAK